MVTETELLKVLKFQLAKKDWTAAGTMDNHTFEYQMVMGNGSIKERLLSDAERCSRG